uniref:Uncharacterized protein n=1 Tax=Parascaris univalens TaxID=6257 RepID=A0A914ZNR1_PARUN
PNVLLFESAKKRGRKRKGPPTTASNCDTSEQFDAGRRDGSALILACFTRNPLNSLAALTRSLVIFAFPPDAVLSNGVQHSGLHPACFHFASTFQSKNCNTCH